MAWQCYKKAADILKNSGFVESSINPCLYVKKSAKGILYIGNNLMIGEMAINDNAIKVLKSKGLVLKFVEGLQDYLSCEIKFSEDNQEYEKEIWPADAGCLESQISWYS